MTKVQERNHVNEATKRYINSGGMVKQCEPALAPNRNPAK